MCPACGAILARRHPDPSRDDPGDWDCPACDLTEPDARIRVNDEQIVDADGAVHETRLRVPGRLNVGNAARALAAQCFGSATPDAHGGDAYGVRPGRPLRHRRLRHDHLDFRVVCDNYSTHSSATSLQRHHRPAPHRAARVFVRFDGRGGHEVFHCLNPDALALPYDPAERAAVLRFVAATYPNSLAIAMAAAGGPGSCDEQPDLESALDLLLDLLARLHEGDRSLQRQH